MVHGKQLRSPSPGSLARATLSRPTGEGLGVRAVHGPRGKNPQMSPMDADDELNPYLRKSASSADGSWKATSITLTRLARASHPLPSDWRGAGGEGCSWTQGKESADVAD